MKKSRRSMQVGDVVRNELSSILSRELHDPAFGLVTVTGVEMSTDLRHARVFVSVLGSERDVALVADDLQKLRGRIRFLLGQKAGLRNTPELDFKPDTTGIRASSIEQILHDVLPHENAPGDESESDNDDE
jgi:ribosome-binding factor A